MKQIVLTLVLSAMAAATAVAQNVVAESAAVESELWIENGNRRIYGIQSVPQNVAKKKVAIVSHGFNGTCDFARDYFRTLNELGYIVYAMDFPCGSVHSRSDNNTMNMSVIDEKEDVKAIVRHFQQQPDVDRNGIVLIGESQGGLVSALAAADLKDDISRLVLIYPALCIPDNWNSRYPNASDILDTIFRFEGPVQIVQGSKDAIVVVRDSERAMKLYKDGHLGIIPGAGHGFKPAERVVSNAFVREFLER